MNASYLFLLGIGAIATLLFLILRLRFHPFVALLSVSVGVALVAGMPAADMGATIEEGMGKTLGHVALIIALGAMIGRMIEVSGGADVLAASLVGKFGRQRAPLALTVAGFAIGIPVFFEVGVIMLMPLAEGMAKQSGKALRVLALPMSIALLIVHALLPPHPGMVAVAGLIGVPLGRILIWGLPLAAVTAAFGFVVAGLLNRGAAPDDRVVVPLEADDVGEHAADQPGVAPVGAGLIVALIVLPIVLILGATLSSILLPDGHPVRSTLAVLGTPFVALLIDAILCGYMLGVRRGWGLERTSSVLGAALPGVALVVLVTGAGGALAKVLVVTGIGGAVSGGLQAAGLPILAMAFLLTMMLRAAQGPTTVALITTAGIIAPALAHAGFDENHLALICLAMGAGGLCASHVNDAGFWIVTRLIGLKVGEGLRSWTVLTTCCGVFAFALIALLWQLA